MFDFLKQFLLNPRKIGAIAPSGKSLAKKMIQPINFKAAKCIVEYGPGTGSFTDGLVANKAKETKLVLIEQNKDFCSELKKKYGSKENVYILHGNAADVCKYLKKMEIKRADCVISGLPFTSLPKKESESILEATKKVIGKKGIFITFQYSMVKRKFFEQFFDIRRNLRVINNLPPAHVLVMKNKRQTLH